MTEEKYQQFVKSLTSTTLEGFTSEEVQECLSIMTRANLMEHALIRAVMYLEAAVNDCPYGACGRCVMSREHFCPASLNEMLKGVLHGDK